MFICRRNGFAKKKKVNDTPFLSHAHVFPTPYLGRRRHLCRHVKYPQKPCALADCRLHHALVCSHSCLNHLSCYLPVSLCFKKEKKIFVMN
ncbi:hypothetical protein Hanom_Chr16g01484931 [Helianthus anomalus]